ncbi:unnamed protein product [Polarella glacialis]|uniref:Transmembrane protein n=1 Tax=Polarella glacialis TaxID=89957 RepID=A0A813FIR5_POLGL|nr:unnamed protein product [Polarella glacialis]CAE8706960.1 unnamed protein product [Polarella glacialis]
MALPPSRLVEELGLLQAYESATTTRPGTTESSAEGGAQDYPGIVRSDSATILHDFQGAGIGVVLSGLMLGLVHFAFASILIWYSSEVPKACVADLRLVFRVMGSLEGVLGVLFMYTFFAGRYLVDAMSHGVLATKYEREGRADEAEIQKAEAAKKVAGAVMQGCLPVCGFVVAQASLVVTWIYGVLQVTGSDCSECGSSVILFWVMLAVNMTCACCVSSCDLTGDSLRAAETASDVLSVEMHEAALP